MSEEPKKWHPQPAEYVQDLSGYYEQYQFPCCGTVVNTDMGQPKQHREDGCQPAPKSETEE